MRVLVTGGCGFIGHHFIEHLIKNTAWDMVVIDKLNYASTGFDRLRDISVFDDKRVKIFTHDMTVPIKDGLQQELGQFDFVVHMAAETHVDQSIADPRPFVMSNVLGTMEMLEFARTQEHLKYFLYFSTDEVFGPADPGQAFKEWDRYNSTNPYSASKAGGEELALAWANTFRVPVVVTHTMNAFGERQHPEKFIPSTIRKVMNDEPVMIHSDSTKTIPGSRFYIHARNISDAIMFILSKDTGWRSKFNIVGEKEVNNLEMAQFIASVLGKKLHYVMTDFHSSRPGHDLRYALDGSKLHRMGWTLPVNFEKSLTQTIEWYLKKPEWLKGG